MLKITTQSDAQGTTLLLEGRLAGPWVEELDRCWHLITNVATDVRAPSQQSAVVVDLTGVTFITPEGKALLTRMYQHGATFHAVGCLTSCIVDEIMKTDHPWGQENPGGGMA
jgi:hypothetical protein